MSFGQEKGDLEQALLGSFLSKRPDVEAAAEILPSLVDWQWESAVGRWLYDALHGSWAKHRELPNPVMLASLLPKTASGEPKDQYLDYLIQARDNGGAPRATFDLLSSLRRKDAIRRKATEVLDALDENKGEDEVVALAASIQSVGAREEATIEDWYENAVERIKGYSKALAVEDRSPRFSTGLPFLDESVGGYGIPVTGRLVMVLASTNVGKSSLTTFMMSRAIRSHKDLHVLDLRTEEIRTDIFSRWDSLLLSLSRLKITNEGIDEQEIARALDLLERNKSLNGRIHIGSIPMRSPIAIARVEIEKVRAKIGKDAKLVVLLDSPDHLRSGQRTDRKHEDIDEVWMAMKGWTTDRNLGCPTTVVTTQSTRDSAGEAPTAETVAGGYDKSRTCDLGIGAYEDGNSKEFKAAEGNYKVLNIGIINKNRLSGEKGTYRQVRAYLDRCHFEEAPRGDQRREKMRQTNRFG